MARTLYEVLEIAPGAEPAEVDAAYASLRQSGEEQSLLRMAYDVLHDPDQRAAYDRKLAMGAAVRAPVFVADALQGKGLRWLLLTIFCAIAAGAWWHGRQPGTIAPQAQVPVPIPVVDEGFAESSTATPALVSTEPRLAPSVQAPSSQATVVGAGQIAVPEHIRPPKKSGFDMDYLAWSAFQVAREKGGTGSGVMIAPEKILTNCHVLAGGATGIWVIHSLTRKPSKVEKYSRLDGEDACLLYAPGAGSDTIEWGRSDQLKPGDKVFSLGHPGGSTNLIWADGQFVAHVNLGENPYLQTAHYCRPGSSGGPLLDAHGRLVGIVSKGDVVERGGQMNVIACYSLPDSSARKLLGKSMFPIGLAPAEYSGN